MNQWHIWCQIKPGAFEYLGQAEGESFENACHHLAESNPAFRADFEPTRMTFNGNPLVPLDRRIDGARVQFGSADEG